MTPLERPLLSVRDLHVTFHTDEGVVRAVDGIDFDIHRGEVVCLVGESGSGKSVTAEALTRLLPSPPARVTGEVWFDGDDLLTLPERDLREIRGARIAYVFQNPQGALNPVYTVGWQLVEAIRLHEEISKGEARERAAGLLARVGIPDPVARFDDYPHEFSGGQKQRVAIAMALAGDPDLLVADEPTTALDVTVQQQILRLLQGLQRDGLAVLLVTHDLGIVAEVGDRVVVLYAGKVMERADVGTLFDEPAHPYSRALLACLPGTGRPTTEGIPGSLPDPTDPPAGCRFHTRCPYAVPACRVGNQPPLHDRDGGQVSCVHFGPDGDPETVLGEDVADAARGGTREERPNRVIPDGDAS